MRQGSLTRGSRRLRLFETVAGLVGLTLGQTSLRAAVISYPNFNNTTGITLDGAASVVNDSGSVIRLAPVSLNKTGSVWFNTRLDLLRGFSTTFTYNIAGGSGADGLSFILQSDPRGLGAIGGGNEGNQLGASGITNSVAVAIRTFIYNRIEVDACGPNQPQKIGGSDTSNLSPPYCVVGSVYQVAKNALRGVHSISVNYTPGTLTIGLDGSTILNTAINIANYVNTPDGKVYVGFTGGTGASTDNHDIRSWSFSNLPDLAVSKTHTGNFFQGQTNAQYQIVISNIGDLATLGAVVTQDNLPPSLTPVSATGTGWTCTSSGNFQCTRSDTLSPGQSYPAITLTVNVAPDAPAQVSNIASVSGGGGLINNSAGDLVQIDGRPDLTITKSHSADLIQGQQGTYTLTVRNIGRGASSNQVVVTDSVPTGLTPVSASGSGWTCDPVSGQNLTCRRSDSLASNGTYPPITVVVVPGASAPANVINTAAVTGGGDINSNNNTASDPTNVRTPPDLTITKSHTGSFMQGQSSATYSITVSNVGGTPTVGQVSVTDNLPIGLLPIGASGSGWTCSFVSKTLNCTRSDSLNAGASYPPITLTVGVAADAPATIPNVVTVAGGSELNTANNSATDSTAINAAPDLTIAKTHSGSFIQGQSGTYAITVSNLGPVPTAGAITVTDPFPLNLTPTSASGSGWTCSIANQTVTCSRADALPAGQSFPPISVSASVASNAPTQVANPASVSGGGDVTPGNNTATDTAPIVGGPDLTITKVHNGTFVQGQPGSYTLTVSNVGQSATVGALNVALDAVPAGLTPTSATGSGWSCTVNGQVVGCRREDPLNPGTAYPPITLSVNVSATAAGSAVNIAAVSGGGDVNPNNNTSTDTATIAGGPDLTVTKTHTGNFRQGQQGAAYTLVVSNAGASPTSGAVTINDAVPGGITPVSAAGSGWTCTVAGQTVDCTRADPLAGGGQYPPITITVNVAPNAPASVTNVVTASGGGDVNPNDNTASDPTTITPEPDLTITKTHAASFTQGQRGATYTITVSNPGSGPSSGAVTVTDTLPAGLTPTAAAGTGWTCNPPSGQTVTCSRSDALAAGASYPVITLSVNVANNAASSLTNTVTVSGGGDVDPTNNTATDNTTVGGGPDLTVTKTHAQDFRQGEQGATYSIVVKNSGLAPTTGQVMVKDTVPAGLTLVGASGTGWSCVSPALQVVTCSRSDALAAGQSYEPITLTVNVAINAASSLSNTVTVSGGGDVNPNNDSDTDVTPVTPEPDLTVTKSHAGNFFQGQQGAIYTVTVSNVGAAPTTGPVTISDSLPAGLTPTAASGPGWTCSVSGQTATCTRSDSIAGSGGDYPSITITANVALTAPASLTNPVTVAGGGDANPANNTANDPPQSAPGRISLSRRVTQGISARGRPGHYIASWLRT